MALRTAQPDDQFVREKGFFIAMAGAEKSLSGLTWTGAYSGSTIKIFRAISGSLAAALALLQLRCDDISIALLPPSHEAAQQAKRQTQEYKSLYARCIQGLKGVNQSVLDSADDVSATKSEGKGASGSLEDEALALAMCCACYAAAAAAARHAAAADLTVVRHANVDGDDRGDEVGEDDSSVGDDESDVGDEDLCDISAAVRM